MEPSGAPGAGLRAVRRALLAWSAAAMMAACAPADPGSPASTDAAAPPVAPLDPAVELFEDRAAETGLDFVHFNGMSGSFYQPEMMGPGAGLLDYDNDGDLDVYLVQGELLGSGTPMVPLPEGQPPGDRLYRNDLEVRPDGTRTLRFTDVTAESGLPAGGYGMGVAAGDYDNDGGVD
ncbi:MAG: VCBS repeat-containing protein, partial [Chloroflexi bacterium]|nr:VCBS repeat-containing protein [Chloroflexota bacterium]